MSIEFYYALFGVFVFFLGIVMGSFLECLADRTTHGISIAKGRSYCPSCGHELSPLDLVPVFSWLFLRGKCRYCKAKIPAKHLIVELFTGIVYLASYIMFGLSIDTLAAILLFSILIPAALSDIYTMEVSDAYTITGLCFFTIVSVLKLIFKELAFLELLKNIGLSLIIPVVLVLIAEAVSRIIKRDAIGGADVKLILLTSLFLGWQKQMVSLLFMCITAMLYFVVLNKIQKKNIERIPLVPFIAISTILSYLFGGFIINGYLHLLGL
jgi:leader peptidase (prepilin peptidase)/N-methyltransferase